MSKYIELLKEKDEVYRLAKRKLSESEITYHVKSELSEEELQSYIAKLEKEFEEKIAKFKSAQSAPLAVVQRDLYVAQKEYDIVKADRKKLIQEFMTKYGKISHETLCILFTNATGVDWDVKYTTRKVGGRRIESCYLRNGSYEKLIARHSFAEDQVAALSGRINDLDWMIYYLYHKGFITKLNNIWQYDKKFAERICSAIESKHIAKIDEKESEVK